MLTCSSAVDAGHLPSKAGNRWGLKLETLCPTGPGSKIPISETRYEYRHARIPCQRRRAPVGPEGAAPRPYATRSRTKFYRALRALHRRRPKRSTSAWRRSRRSMRPGAPVRCSNTARAGIITLDPDRQPWSRCGRCTPRKGEHGG